MCGIIAAGLTCDGKRKLNNLRQDDGKRKVNHFRQVDGERKLNNFRPDYGKRKLNNLRQDDMEPFPVEEARNIIREDVADRRVAVT